MSGEPGTVHQDSVDERLQRNWGRFAPVASAFVEACIDRAVPRDTLALLPAGRRGSREKRESLRFLGYGWHLDVEADSSRAWFFLDDGTVQHASAWLLPDGMQEAVVRWLRGPPSRAFVTGRIWVVPREITAHQLIDADYVSMAMQKFLAQRTPITGNHSTDQNYATRECSSTDRGSGSIHR